MPLTMAPLGEERMILRITGRDHVQKHLANLGFVTGGNVTVSRIEPEHLAAMLPAFEEMGCELFVTRDSIKLKAPKRINAVVCSISYKEEADTENLSQHLVIKLCGLKLNI